MKPMVRNVIFDLGGVLIDWNPRYLYRSLFANEQEMEKFLAEVCNQHWNEKHDEGKSFAENSAELIAKHPKFENEIRAYGARFGDMLKGPIQGTVEILEALKERGQHKLLGLSNWSAETFPIAEKRYPFLQLFEGIVVSGRINMRKPQAAIFNHLCRTYQVLPAESQIGRAHV